MDIKFPEDIPSQRMAFRHICNDEELERVFNIKSPEDYLFLIRAETIVDHMRLFRVYRNKKLYSKGNWSLEDSFDTYHFEQFLDALNDTHRKECEEITYGNIFSNKASGTIFTSNYGPIITISESLEYFLKFANLTLIDFDTDIPVSVRFNSLRIAIRIMLQQEAMDFHMDPRGIIPKKIQNWNNIVVSNQMKFIAGHEFSHYLCDHIDKKNICEENIYKDIFSDGENHNKTITFYNQSQTEEFIADATSIELPNYNPHDKTMVITSALYWFAALDLYEHFIEKVTGRKSGLGEHPSAIKRYESLLNNVSLTKDINKQEWLDYQKNLDVIKEFINNDVDKQLEQTYRFYGSCYLAEPNTKWRGKHLIDRKDYY
ncbi:MAG: hypothetical protein JKX79_03035 [Labilibaculum sp.]|nr:hypothetical protein [Labilibaculum sp.]